MSSRYPLAPLEALVGRPSAGELADWLGVTRQAVHTWRRRGLSERQADEVATRLGWHPVLIWPTWLADNVEPWFSQMLAVEYGERGLPRRGEEVPGPLVGVGPIGPSAPSCGRWAETA